MKPLIVWLFIAVIAASCDPMRRIRMKNQTSDKAEVIWTLKKDSIHSSPLFISNTEEVVFTLTPAKPGNFISLSCGIGKWSTEDIEALADDLESLVIRWNTGEIRLDSAQQIKNYLLPRRKGMDRAKLMIVVKD